MVTRVRCIFLWLLALVACSNRSAMPTQPGAAAAPIDAGYTSYVSGSQTDVQTSPLGGALLAGGGTDSDAGMRWLLAQGGARSAGAYGDVVVLRTSGGNGYNDFLLGLGANSVTSIVITSEAGANNDFVQRSIAKAEVVFIAGGDQSTYVNRWTGTSLQKAVNARVAAGYPIGGTSAGLAVLSPFVYAALNESSTSAVAMANPFDTSITITDALFNVPILQNLITDSHFVVRDRMGRLVTFLARLQQDARSTAPRGIGVDEKSAVGVLRDGSATVFGAGNGAYFLSVASSALRVCRSNTPLSYAPVTTVRVPVGSQFNLASWTATASTPYELRASSGVLSSSTGSVY